MLNTRRLLLIACAVAACVRPDSGGGGVVAAASPEAAQAGLEVLAAGGNAIDAMVAVQFALGVTEPAMSGLGGQTQVLMMGPAQPPLVINGTSFAPAVVPGTVTPADLAGHRKSTIPTTVRLLDYAWRHHGSGNLTWAELIAPAIRLAEEGFVVGPFRARVWDAHRENLRADSSAAALFLIDDEVPAEGSVFRQPVLARTLRRLAEAGASDFYRGEIARGIAADMERRGGWITAADLADLPDPVELGPLHTTYHGFDVYALPPPGGGWVVLQTLNLLEAAPADALQPDAPSRTVELARALRISHRSRRVNPVTDLIDYGAAAGDRISKATADSLRRADTGRGETTHFTVVDDAGLVVSATASINAYFGSRSTTPSLGFLYNSYMDEFELDRPEHPFALRGGAMPYSSMSPTIVAQDGQPVLGLGSPGSARIISAVAQVAQLWMDGLPLAEAVARPRVHVVGEDELYLEAAPTTTVLDALGQLGFRLVEPNRDLMIGNLNAYYGGVHAVAREGEGWVGAADPRRDGAVARHAKP